MYFSFLQAEQLQIANYYDLFNSLINWSSRKWGCSGGPFKKTYSLYWHNIERLLYKLLHKYLALLNNIHPLHITVPHYRWARDRIIQPEGRKAHATQSWPWHTQRERRRCHRHRNQRLTKSSFFVKKCFYKTSFNVVWLTVPNNQTPIDLSVL